MPPTLSAGSVFRCAVVLGPPYLNRLPVIRHERVANSSIELQRRHQCRIIVEPIVLHFQLRDSYELAIKYLGPIHMKYNVADAALQLVSKADEERRGNVNVLWFGHVLSPQEIDGLWFNV
ncbi:hypothetical protein HOI83_02555 [Candidatus Uhrbacteria bacterium]|nr:hypothetical protein [Candidatus Uhrbacteria bacterium]